MELKPDDVIVLDHPHNALQRAIEHLELNPAATAIAFVEASSLRDSSLTVASEAPIAGLQSLVAALEPEKVVAVEPRCYATSVFTKYSPLMHPVLVSSITASISVFKAAPMRDHADLISQQLGPLATVTDLSLYFNQLGLSSVAAPVDEAFFGAIKHLSREDQIPREWDAYVEHVERFERQNPTDFFARFQESLQDHESPRVLIDASGFSGESSGTSRNVVGFLTELDAALEHNEVNWSVTVVASEHAFQKAELNLIEIERVTSFHELDSSFDLGVTITPVTSIERCITISRWCLRWMVLQLDVIALRSLPHLSQHVFARNALRLIASEADHVVFISEFSRNDAEALISPLTFPASSVHPQGVPDEFASEEASDRDFQLASGAVFVAGNDLPHKQTQLAVSKLCNAGLQTVSISSEPPLSPNHRVFRPGELTDADLKALMLQCSVVVFPSLYEGFGLPTAEAAELGKPLILWDTAVSREVATELGVTHALFCGQMSELPQLARKALELSLTRPSAIPRISHFNAALRHEMAALLETPVDIQRLIGRWRQAMLLTSAADERDLRVREELHRELRVGRRIQRLFKRFRRRVRSALTR